MTEIINLTPHPLNLELGGKMVEIPSSGVARCATTVVDVIENLNGLSEEDKDYFREICADLGVRLVTTSFGEVVGLPEPQEGKIYVVSAMVLAALKGSRRDVFGPADYIRDESGKIVGARALTR